MEPERYPISVRLVGVMHKEKKKMYVVSVLWSDQNDIVVYRTFGDFQKLHKQMKKMFPSESKVKGSDRVIPKFPKQKEKHNSQMKRGSKSLARLKLLQKYCNDLLGCDPRVCQCTDLVQFFHPTQEDLQPEFSKNSILVMPSDDNQSNSGGGNVTKPFVTETYCCVAAYETKDTKNKPFKVATDEKVDVLIKDKGGWWLVENEEKQMAWFPAPYLEKLDSDSGGDEDELDGSIGRGARYTAIKNYKATKNDEISVSIGAVVEVLQESDNGWWLIRYKGKAGYIPSVYLRPYNYPHIHLTPSHTERPNTPHLQIPSLGQQFSRSQENLLARPSSRPSSPRLLQPESKLKSRSLNVLDANTPTPSIVVPSYNRNHSNGSARPHVPPTITVQMDDDDDDEEDRRLGNYSQGSFDSESDYSFDELSMSYGSSSLNLDVTEDQHRHSYSPQPPRRTLLSPTMAPRLMPSISDPNLYKSPASPTIPPRPKPQQIMSRCTTITRKNATKGE